VRVLAKKKKQSALATIQKSLKENAEEFMGSLQQEIVEEEQKALKDFMKGAYRLILEKQRAKKQIEAEIKEIEDAMDAATKGEWEKLGAIKVPARFFSEETLRKHGYSYLEGRSEIRFIDLYGNNEEE
jgi:gamma-glutamyl phosphate reductase